MKQTVDHDATADGGTKEQDEVVTSSVGGVQGNDDVNTLVNDEDEQDLLEILLGNAKIAPQSPSMPTVSSDDDLFALLVAAQPNDEPNGSLSDATHSHKNGSHEQ